MAVEGANCSRVRSAGIAASNGGWKDAMIGMMEEGTLRLAALPPPRDMKTAAGLVHSEEKLNESNETKCRFCFQQFPPSRRANPNI